MSSQYLQFRLMRGLHLVFLIKKSRQFIRHFLLSILKIQSLLLSYMIKFISLVGTLIQTRIGVGTVWSHSSIRGTCRVNMSSLWQTPNILYDFSYCLGTSAANFLQTIMVISQVNMLTHNRIGVGSIQGSITCLCHPKMNKVRQQIWPPYAIFDFSL